MIRSRHSIRALTISWMMLLVSGSTAPAADISESGTAGLSFLTIAPSAELAALGGGGSAHVFGPAAMWANPALIAGIADRAADFNHTIWIGDITYEYISFATPLSMGALGISAQLFDSGDIEGRDKYGSPTGLYSVTNAAFGVTYAARPLEWLAAGVKYKHLFQKVSEDTAGGWAIDAGLTADTPITGLTFGLAGRNYGSMGKLRNHKTTLPSSVIFGGEYRGTAPYSGREYTAVADALFPRHGDNGIRLGLRYDASEYLDLMVGYRNDSEFEQMIYGFDVTLQRMTASFAYSPFSGVSDEGIRVSLSVAGF